MKRIFLYLLLFLSFLINNLLLASNTDANIVGHVVSGGDHLPFANIIIVGTTIGTATDETGHYRLINLPIGKTTIRAQSVGYKPKEFTLFLEAGKTSEIKFDLEKDVLGMEEVVVTGDRTETNRKKASTIVNTLSPKTFTSTNALTFADALNFTPGVRTENNCQNCGFSQVRMNGLEGPYSQILINGRQIFSGLAGVYGLEIIPTNMIERVEVLRGGASALYGSNAVAGTINLILKDPIQNTYEASLNSGFIGAGVDGTGGVAPEHTINLNASVISNDHKVGMSIYGFVRDRKEFDANDDSFSEIVNLQNISIGGRIFHRLGVKSKISLDFFHLNEKRRGGDKFDYPVHEANIAEALEHNLTTGALTFDQFFRTKDLLSIYIAGQSVDRASYYGAEKSLQDYGQTDDFTYNIGAQYNAVYETSNLVFGAEQKYATLIDKKLGYPDYENAVIDNGVIIEIPHTNNVTVADQTSNTIGAFAQYDINWNKFKFSLGGRFDYYNISDKENNGEDKDGNVFSPRVNILYDIQGFLQARISYSQGYRAPQIFDEDLHIETSGSRKVLHKNDPNLKQETSHSFMASLDFNKQLGHSYFGFLAEGFYTKLNDPFVNEYGEQDEDGTVIYTRKNSDKGATVAGVNLELNYIPQEDFNIQAGFTMQSSEYEEEHEFGETKFFRTPDNYGYFTLDYKPIHKLGISATGNYTGTMLIPYFGSDLADPEMGELKNSETFLDLGLKLRYNIKLNGASLQLFGGVKNIFNSYQDKFDVGIDRDPGYVYGPLYPRTVYVGFKIGNIVN